MTQPFPYDPSQQQPGQPSAPFDPAQQQQPGQPEPPFDPAQQQQPQQPSYEPGQAASSPFGPTAEPPMFPPPSPNFLPPQPPKKSKSGLFIVMGIVVLLLIGGGIGVAIWRPWAPAAEVEDKADTSDEKGSDGKDDAGKNDDKEDSDQAGPSQVVDDAWHAKDWNEAKSYMCEKLVTELEESGAAENYKPIGEDEEFKTTGEDIDGDNAKVTVETTVASSEGSPEIGKITVHLVKENSDWKICEIGEPQ